MFTEITSNSGSLSVLIVDEESNGRTLLAMCLGTDGHQVMAVRTVQEAQNETIRQAFDLIFLNIHLGVQTDLDFIPQLLLENPWTRIIALAAHSVHQWVSDYLPKPFDAFQVSRVTRKVAEHRQLARKIEALQTALAETDPEADLHAVDPVMLNALNLARQVAQSQTNLSIAGEAGSGKTRLAAAIHRWSDRANQPLAVINCRANTADSLETELFAARGKAEFCDGGTLIMENADELPKHLQPRIFRLLRDREFERLDQTTRRKTNLRIIATTTVDLQKRVDAGTFRADLLLALNIVQIEIPPLRNRPDDIPLLAQRYLALLARQNHRAVTAITPQAMHVLTRHLWPGNVRELRNLIERAVLLCGGEHIGVEHLPPNLLSPTSSISIGDLVPLARVEEQHVRQVVASARSLRQAAGILGVDAATVVRRMKRYKTNNDQ